MTYAPLRSVVAVRNQLCSDVKSALVALHLASYVFSTATTTFHFIMFNGGIIPISLELAWEVWDLLSSSGTI
jgi:hypothetical protein